MRRFFDTEHPDNFARVVKVAVLLLCASEILQLGGDLLRGEQRKVAPFAVVPELRVDRAEVQLREPNEFALCGMLLRDAERLL